MANKKKVEKKVNKFHFQYNRRFDVQTFRIDHNTVLKQTCQRHCRCVPARGQLMPVQTIVVDNLPCRADRKTNKYHRTFAGHGSAFVVAAAGMLDWSPFDFEMNAQIHQDLFQEEKYKKRLTILTPDGSIFKINLNIQKFAYQFLREHSHDSSIHHSSSGYPQ